MKLKNIMIAVLLGVMTMSLVGCGTKDTSEQTTKNPSQTIVITGSTSVEKILNDMIDEFVALNPDVKINYTGTGSSAGISDTLAGTNSIGVSSREVKEEEKVDGLVEEVFAYDGIAIVVHPANEISDLSTKDILGIYSGDITNWSQVGGKDKEIVIVSREGSSGTRDAFEELIGLKEIGLTEDATVVEGNGNVQTTVAGNENAIGYVSFSYINETVKDVTVDGVKATAENAKSGDYMLSRPFLFVSMDSKITNEGKAFIEYAKSADGQAFVEKHGGIRID